MTCDNRTVAEQIADELDAISDDLDQYLVDEGVRYVYTQTLDAMGGRTETWVATGAPFPCTKLDRSRQSPEPVRLGERIEQPSANIILKVPLDQTFEVRDRVLVNGTVKLEILTKQDSGSLSFLHTYGCVEVEP